MTATRPCVRALGFDLSANLTGWAVVDLQEGGVPREHMRLRAHGLIRLPSQRQVKGAAEGRAAWNRHRFLELQHQVGAVISAWMPDKIGYEWPDRPFRAAWAGKHRKGVGATPGSEFNAAQGLGLSEGMFTAVLALVTYPPFEVLAVPVRVAKQAATMSGTATGQQSKQHVARALEVLYGFSCAGVSEDETDAASVAVAVLDPPQLREQRAEWLKALGL